MPRTLTHRCTLHHDEFFMARNCVHDPVRATGLYGVDYNLLFSFTLQSVSWLMRVNSVELFIEKNLPATEENWLTF